MRTHVMSRTTVTLVLLLPALAAAQTVRTPVAEAFDHYEAIRAALAGDQIAGLDTHAAALAPLAEQVAGKEAGTLASGLGGSKTLAAARDQFGSLSMLLVPRFLEAELPGVVGYACAMKSNASWAQRADKIQNPYFGKAMLECGARIETPR